MKSLGRWYAGNLTDRSRDVEVYNQEVQGYNQAVEGLKNIEHSKLAGKFKLLCMQIGLYPKIALATYDI